jgi:hypothetical protein
MGYETRIIIVEKCSYRLGNDTKVWAEKIAEFNLCKMDYKGPYMIALSSFRKTDCYFYSGYGETEITEDLYGDELREIPIKPLIQLLKNEDQDYRRIKPIIKLLEGISETFGPDAVALHYGY